MSSEECITDRLSKRPKIEIDEEFSLKLILEDCHSIANCFAVHFKMELDKVSWKHVSLYCFLYIHWRWNNKRSVPIHPWEKIWFGCSRSVLVCFFSNLLHESCGNICLQEKRRQLFGQRLKNNTLIQVSRSFRSFWTNKFEYINMLWGMRKIYKMWKYTRKGT